ncbi:pyridoxine kinase [Amorphus suaedae]
MTTASPAAVVVISSLVARGGIGLRAAGFALERLGHQVWSVPTVFLPWHPGHGPSTRIVPPVADFEAALADLAETAWLDEVGAVISGYLGSAEQAPAVARFVRRVKERKPDIRYLCDPVSADDGGLYVPDATAEAIRSELLPLADIATPNRFELAWMTGRSIETINETLDAARALGPQRVLVTSAPALMRNSVAMLYTTPRGAWVAEHPLVAHPPHGPGDLSSALLIDQVLAGHPGPAALERTAAGAYEIVARSAKAGSDELMVVAEQGRLARPMAMVQMRRIAEARA